MSITIINTHDLVGGAERCSYDLASGLYSQGESVSLIVGGKYGNDDFVRKLTYRYFDYKLRAFLFRKLGITDSTLIAPFLKSFWWPELRNATIFNIHNMHGAYWNFWTLPLLANRAPLVLTLHDEWLLTGDCAYTYDCRRWLHSCGQCPQVNLSPFINRYAIGGRDATRFNILLKRRAVRTVPRDRMVIVAPSKWLIKRAEKTPHLSPYRLIHIEYGIDLNVFRPFGKIECRNKFNLPLDKRLIFMSAANLSDRRKNFRLISDLIQRKALPSNALLICAGAPPPLPELKQYEGLPIQFLGYLSSKDDMARILAACDISLILSQADNLPYVGIEALACGCPIIGTRVGGIPEIIQDGVTGWLISKDCQVAELAGMLDSICSMDSAKLDHMGSNARAHAKNRYDISDFVTKYRNTFTELSAKCA